MNTVMVSAQAGMPNAASAAAGAVAGTGMPAAGAIAGNGAGTNVSGFAALLLGLIPTGDTESAATTPLLSLSLPTSAVPVPSEAEGDSADEADALAAMLDRLAQMIEAMPSDWKQQFIAWAPVQTWMGSANIELALLSGDLSALSGLSPNQEQSNGSGRPEANPAYEFMTVLAKLSEALTQSGGNAQLQQVAADVKKVTADFITAFQSMTTLDADVNDSAAQTKNAAGGLFRRTGSDMLRQSASAQLAQMNGNISLEADQKTAGPGATAASTHLAAIDSKFSAVKLALISESGQQSSSDRNAYGGSSEQADNNSFTGLVTDAGKALNATAAPKGEAIPQSMNAEAFADEMADWMLKQSLGGKSGILTEAKIMLKPEHLGQLEVKLSMHNGQLVALFHTESAAAKDMLESNLAALRMNLSSSGVQVEKLEVSQQQAAQGSGLFGQEGKQRQGAERDSRQSKKREAEGIDEWAETLGLRLDETEGKRVRSYGSSFHATA
ncbi:flagellar hook-length control protein FliK [Paenibacillus thermotolerans]|uniref:flagellar hook-length control protein FliK n=1 Tax=Paenibacillus thermotolerans TaxID=3027807 RepID=UPI0023675AEE|nr:MULTISPECIES: flagellar hook-length control protein FliK [unclassified Paenibacillus]